MCSTSGGLLTNSMLQGAAKAVELVFPPLKKKPSAAFRFYIMNENQEEILIDPAAWDTMVPDRTSEQIVYLKLDLATLLEIQFQPNAVVGSEEEEGPRRKKIKTSRGRFASIDSGYLSP